MVDLYRYFRIEARELVDELASGLVGLSQGGSTADLVGLVLRHAHTLKGAARVVSQAGIADRAHALEELLEPYRGSTDLVADEPLLQMQALVDEISAEVETLDAGGEPTLRPPTQEAERPGRPSQNVPPGESTPAAADEHLHEPTARASLIEIDAILGGVLETRAQLSMMRQKLQSIQGFRAQLHADPAPGPNGRLDKITSLELAADELYRSLSGCTDRMDRDLRGVHDGAERLRLIPVESIIPDLQRSVRDVAAAQGKRVSLDVVGSRIALDAPVLAVAQTALRQIVRNAVAHGLETPHERVAAGKQAIGQIRVAVTHSTGGIVFSCTDDGRGIDLSAVRVQLARGGVTDVSALDDAGVLELLMAGGVSTASTVSEISGRGIGLDIVRDAARQLGGRVTISTRFGAGTTIDLRTPPSLTAQNVILADAGDVVAVPMDAVQATARISADDITTGARGQAVIHEGRSIPFLPLETALETGPREGPGLTSHSYPAWSLMILSGSQGPVAIGTRRLIGTAEVAVRPLPPLAPISNLVCGLWMDVEGRPRLVLNTAELAVLAGQQRSVIALIPKQRAPILIVDDSLTTRMLEQTILESAGYQVELASSAEEGLALAASRPFCLVVVDVEMPGMDGFAFVEQTRTRAELRHLPCILVTSRASADDRRRGLEAGARAHIDKGEFHQGALLDRISELLAN
jgi:two-component system chemotaxis sensor kinase CheA